ncbi:MAG TPA: hypothetical protein VF533_10395 [Solirubrobacteraceae bacterium]|jgi:hypothetical protein
MLLHRLLPGLAVAAAAAALGTAQAAAAPRVERVSVSSAGAEGDAESGVAADRAAAISAGGRFVAFVSAATDLAPGDPGSGTGVFLRDRERGTTTRLSGDAGGVEPSISRGGGTVLFASLDARRRRSLSLYSRSSGATRRLQITRKGVPDRDLRIVSAVLAADGRHVAILAGRRDVGQDVRDVTLSVLDRRTGRSRLVLSRPYDDFSPGLAISADGRRVAFATGARLVRGDRDGRGDVYAIDVKTGRRRWASRGLKRYCAEPVISGNGRHVAFTSDDDVYVRDLRRGRLRRATAGGGVASAPSLSDDGRRVAYQRSPTDVIADGDGPIGEVEVRDRRTGRTIVASPGGEGRSGFPALAGSARVVAFGSAATGLVAGDANGVPDVFVATF